MSTWKCEEPILKKVRFTPYPHFIVYDFEAILAPLIEHPTDDLTYLSRLIPITRDEFEQFLKLFKENDCTMMGDWLRIYNVVDVVPFIEAFRQYYPDKIDV